MSIVHTSCIRPQLSSGQASGLAACTPRRQFQRQEPCRSQRHLPKVLSGRLVDRTLAEDNFTTPVHGSAELSVETASDVWQALETSTQQIGSSSILPVACSTALAVFCLPDAAWAFPGVAAPVPVQIFGFLLGHPVVTLAIAGVAIWAIPRLARAAVRFILIPAAFLGIGYLIVTNPRTSFAFAGGALSYVSSHPVITSAVILVGLSFVLSPYILAAGASVLLIGGYKVLPAQLRFLVPAPVMEVDKQLTGVRQKLFRSGQEMQREAPSVKADPDDIFGRLKNIISN